MARKYKKMPTMKGKKKKKSAKYIFGMMLFII